MAHLKIDRSRSLDLRSDLLGSGYFSREEINPKSNLVTEVDPSKIKLVSVLGRDVVDPALVSTTIEKRLNEIDASGATLLDAKVLEALLANQQTIPSEWASIADQSWYGDESGSICFYGSVFHQISRGEETVLQLCFERGHWFRIYAPARFSKAELERFTQSGKFSYSRILAAVI